MDGHEKAKAPEWLAWLVNSKVLYATIALVFVLYLVTKSPLFALLTALSVVSLFVAESMYSASKTGWKNEIKEILIAVFVALIAWYGGGFVLQTSAPLDAIVSCSMLPNLERGDMVVLRGGVASAPEVLLSRAEFEAVNWSRHQVVCAYCERTNYSTGQAYTDLCLAELELTPTGYSAVRETFQFGNPIQYECGVCTRRKADGSTAQVPCTKAITVKGQRIEPNYTNDVVVYTPAKGDLFRGETIHRALVRFNVEGKTYYLTKGDNNEQLDIQYLNSVVPQEKVVGRVLLRLPYVGYLKLFLFGFLTTPAGCDSVLLG